MGIKKAEKAIIVGIATPGIRNWQAQEHLNELARLVETASAQVVRHFIQRLRAFNAATLIGKGKVEEIFEHCQEVEAKLVVFDDDLSGSQVRNLEKMMPGIKILDRTGIILDIFARHAHTAESRIMVEIAQLEYSMPRLTRAWTHLSRQVGGIGTRGPGETQLEVDRRNIRKRIKELKKRLKKIECTREMQAENRYDTFHIAVVGYTNAGKSTLTNQLTDAEVLVADKLFATLDATTRQIFLDPHKKAILSDTVGFIRKLPHRLITTFRSTLGVASSADCILEILDANAPDYKEHLKVTQSTLKNLIPDDIPRVRVFNKIDCIDDNRHEELKINYPEAILISAQEQIGFAELKGSLNKVYDRWKAQRENDMLEQQENDSLW